MLRRHRQAAAASSAASSSASKLSRQLPAIDDVERLLKRMHSGLDIKDRRWHGSLFPECFVGSECISWLVAERIASDRLEAEQLGNSLLEQGHFTHVTGEHPLEDRYLFYRFVDSKTGRRRKELQASTISMARQLSLQQHQILNHKAIQ